MHGRLHRYMCFMYMYLMYLMYIMYLTLCMYQNPSVRYQVGTRAYHLFQKERERDDDDDDE